MVQPPPPPPPLYQPQYRPRRQSRGLFVLIGVLALALVAVVVIGALVLVRNMSDPEPKAGPGATPASSESVQFRRVITATAGACTTSPGVVCGPDYRYTLGKVELDGTHVHDVRAIQQPGQTSWYVLMNLDDEGTRVFANLTADLARRQPPKNQLAIVVGGKVAAAPSVTDRIPEGQIQIVGNYTQKDAQALVDQIGS